MKTRHRLAIAALSLLLLTSMAFGQQAYIGRYDIYTGFMYLNSSAINLGETGFHTQVGVNMKKWYAMGFDFSTGAGDTALVPSMLKTSLQQQIAAELGQLGLPANTVIKVPMHSTSQTYALGPQLNYRHFAAFTLFIHPDLGAMHEAATPHPTDFLGKAFVQQYAASGVKTDWTYFWGVGGGIDLNVTRHYGVRIHMDFVHDYLFSDLLPARNELRVSIGPTVHFGSNVAEKK